MKLQEEIKELESTVEKCEEDRTTKDSQMRTLRDEIAHQEDMIVKLGKEKKDQEKLWSMIWGDMDLTGPLLHLIPTSKELEST